MLASFQDDDDNVGGGWGHDSIGDSKEKEWDSWEALSQTENTSVCENVFDIMRDGSLSQVERFVGKYGLEYSLQQRDEYGHTPTHWLALNGHSHVFRSVVNLNRVSTLVIITVRFLVQNRGHVNHHSNNVQGPRPIHWASRNGHVAVVDILMSKAGVSVDATDHKGLTPLMMACMFGRSMMAAYLLGKGAAPHLTDINGDSALHWAAYKGFPGLMQMLINSGFNPQKPDNFGSSPLHLACISGNIAAVKLLCAKVHIPTIHLLGPSWFRARSIWSRGTGTGRRRWSLQPSTDTRTSSSTWSRRRGGGTPSFQSSSMFGA